MIANPFQVWIFGAKRFLSCQGELCYLETWLPFFQFFYFHSVIAGTSIIYCIIVGLIYTFVYNVVKKLGRH